MGHIVFRTNTRRKTLQAKHDPQEPRQSRAVEHRLVLPSPPTALQKEMLEGGESYRGVCLLTALTHGPAVAERT